MSTLQNLNQNSLYLPANSIITTPLDKVLNIINEAKRFINMMSKNQSKLIRELEWVIKVIASHSLYKYEIKDLDKIEKYTKDNPDFKQFVDFVYEYNEEVIEMNKKKNMINSQSVKMSNELLQIPSFKLKRKNIQQGKNNISSSYKRNKGFSHQKMNSFSSTGMFKNSKNLSLSSLKQLLKFNQAPIPNYIPLKNQSKANFKSSLELKNSKNNKIQSLFRSFNSNNQNNSNQSLKNSRANSLENKIESSFSYIEHALTGANFDPKTILEKDFNIFELKKIIGHGNVLPLMGKTILECFGLLDNNIIETKKLDNFLYSITKQYHVTTLYHNSMHGADVTQTICLFFLNSNAEEVCSTNVLDLLSILIAALGHDIGHPGLTNNFQINASTDMALTYNDISCLENFHVSKLFKTIKKDENNIFQKLNVNDYKSIRKRMISEILATDMANHGKVMGIVKTKLPNENTINNEDNKNENNENKKFEYLSNNPKTKFEEQQSLLDFFIHAADLAHNTKLFKISIQWVELLTNEFWLQGDKEKELNLPVSFLCDRIGSDIPSSQVGFISGFILPTFDVLIVIFPTLNYTVENAKNNIAEWKKLVEQHRLTGWTPREKKEGKENGISKKDINKNNNSLNGGNNINGSHLDNNNNNITTLKGNNKIINHNNINKINPVHSEDIKKSYTANWGKPKLITIKKQGK